MVWNTMILSQYVMVRHIVGKPVGGKEREGIVRHYRVTQTPEGGWGMHGESGPYVFFTTLAYVALRLLGLGAEEPLVASARRWLHAQPGGVLGNPSWGKYWLAFLGLYDYRGVNPCPPELFLLPEWLPLHPTRYYCHTRNIYMGLSYLYGSRFRADLGPIAGELCQELYGAEFDAIDFRAHRNDVAATDVYVRPGRGVRLTFDALTLYERVPSAALRRRALDHCFERILYEQRTSRYQGLSPVNGLLNCLALHARDPRHPDLAPSLEGMERWKWDDEAEGIRYAGARSNTWDTAFAIQTVLSRGTIAADAIEPLRRAYRFLDGAQLTEELPRGREEHRDPARGGWCFSDGEHRWPVSDCTAEALTAILGLHEAGAIDPADRIGDERLRQAAEFILLRQNDDGGFGTYERRRGSAWLESVNPTEMYGNCMTERSYIECTASAIAALSDYRRAHAPALTAELKRAIDESVARGLAFLRGAQWADGSWPGFWGVNFTYGIFHVVKGMLAAGVPATDPALARAAAWLVDKQRADGGWGEHYTGCLENRYLEHPHSQTVMTSWALLALVEVLGPGAEPVTRGFAWLRAQQSPDGSFPGAAQNGVFFGSAMLDYRYYKAYFPAWALARHATLAR